MAEDYPMFDKYIEHYGFSKFTHMFKEFTGVNISRTTIYAGLQVEYSLDGNITQEEKKKINEFGSVKTP